jgi:arsenite methyltransferase
MSAVAKSGNNASRTTRSDWITNLLNGHPPEEDEEVLRNGQRLVGRGGLTRAVDLGEGDQAQTRDMFGFKWGKRDTYASKSLADLQIEWLESRYGGRDLLQHLNDNSGSKPLVLDAGAGAGFTGKLILRNNFKHIKYVGADISSAIDIAAEEISPLGDDNFFIQSDLMSLPFLDNAFDIVLSEGVMHHTPSTRDALLRLARHVRPGGIFAFYVYVKKAPIREFTDDHIRALVVNMQPADAWAALEPLTKLGIALGELGISVDVPEDVSVLGIPKGKIDVQRLFYWSICKMYYRPELSLDEMNHINFDWFTPKFAHRQTPDEVTLWCGQAGLSIEHMKVEDAGITVVARKPEL